jgi:ATP-dependent RNA helicase DDX5/DBP2
VNGDGGKPGRLTELFSFDRYIRSEGHRGGGSGFGRSSGGYGDSGGIARRNDRFNGRVEKNGFGGMGGRNKSSLDEQQLRRINWSQETLAPLRKNFYKASATTLARPRAEIEAYQRKHEVTVRGHDTPTTIFDFNEVGFPSYITTELSRQGFKAPTVIQSQSWPIAMSGRDLVGIAQTGSGKSTWRL